MLYSPVLNKETSVKILNFKTKPYRVTYTMYIVSSFELNSVYIIKETNGLKILLLDELN